MCASFIAAGTSAYIHIALIMRVVMVIVGFPPCLRSSAVIPSGPGAFLFGSELRVSMISGLDGGGPVVFLFSSLGGSAHWYKPFQKPTNSATCPLVSSV